jgi:hypothetical protein
VQLVTFQHLSPALYSIIFYSSADKAMTILFWDKKFVVAEEELLYRELSSAGAAIREMSDSLDSKIYVIFSSSSVSSVTTLSYA